MKKPFKKVGIGIIFLMIFGFIIIKYIVPYFLLSPPRIVIDTVPKELELESEELELKTFDELVLKGYWIHSKLKETNGIIILVHGIGGCKEHFYELSLELARKGIATVLFDNRAHGKSEGKYCTYGYHEKKDISIIIDEIKLKEPNLPLGIWGNSLGVAIAIQTLEYDKRIEFGIIEVHLQI